MILGLHHAALAVENIETALAFYCEVVGFEVVMQAEIPPGIEAMNQAMDIDDASFKVCMIQKGDTRIELFEFNQFVEAEDRRPVNRLGITHIALSSDSVEQDFELLSANGVRFNSALFGATPSRFAYGRDPFGNVIELLEYTAS
jgi:catechol 2,3-dioxygenase-like lactoylglutathione lyase family enzyme